jgi:hypothetical protein
VTDDSKPASNAKYFHDILEKMWEACKSWRGVAGFINFIVLFSLLTYSVTKIIQNNETKISTANGIILISNNKSEAASLLVMPSGSKDGPWVETGIKVTQKDKIYITASGRVHTSLKRLIKAAQSDEVPETPWVGPDGLHETEDLSPAKNRGEYKLLPDINGAYYGIGMLVAGIRTNSGQYIKEPIGSKHEFTPAADGLLVLAINDVWLEPKSKDAYVPPLSDYPDYYKQKALEKLCNTTDSLAEPELSCNKISENQLNSEMERQYKLKQKKWHHLQSSGNWGAWYTDNVGAFAVSISITPPESDYWIATFLKSLFPDWEWLTGKSVKTAGSTNK